MPRLSYLLWLALALVCGSAFAQEQIRWAPDIATARRAAAQFQVPLMIHFHGDNCLPCKTLEQRVLSKPEVIKTLNQYFICAQVNATQDRRTAAEFQVHSWPTDVFVSPDGKTLYQGVCQQDLAGYMGVLENVAVMNRDRNIMLAANKTSDPTAITQQVAPVGTAGTMATNNLPAPNANLVSNTQSTNYYTNNQSGSPKLMQSSVPTPSVQAGPLLASQQPQSLTGSTPASQQQIGSPELPKLSIDVPTGKLPPPPTTIAQAPAPQQNNLYAPPNANINLPSIAQVGPVGSTAAVAAHQPNAVGVQNGPYEMNGTTVTDMSTSNTLENQHYVAANVSQQMPALSLPTDEAMTQPARANEQNDAERKIAATSVSFQPRTPSSNRSETLASLQGFCPVAFKQSKSWATRGSEEFAVKHRGKVYWMSSKEAVQQFLADPDGLSPVMSGYDPMVFLSKGELVEGNISYGLQESSTGRMILFSSEESREAFRQDSEKNMRALDVILDQLKSNQ